MKVQEDTKLVKDINEYLKAKGYVTPELMKIGLRIFASKISDQDSLQHGIDIDDLYARAYYVINNKNQMPEEDTYSEKRILEFMAWGQ